MVGGAQVAVVGSLGAYTEQRQTASGLLVTSFTVASTPREFDRGRCEFVDGEPLRLRTYDDTEGQGRATVEIDAGWQRLLRLRSFPLREGDD